MNTLKKRWLLLLAIMSLTNIVNADNKILNSESHVESIVLDKSTYVCRVGETIQPKFSVYPEDAIDKDQIVVKWSGNPSIKNLDEVCLINKETGAITGVKKNEVDIWIDNETGAITDVKESEVDTDIYNYMFRYQNKIYASFTNSLGESYSTSAYVWIVDAANPILPTTFNTRNCFVNDLNKVHLEWDKVEGATGYELKWAYPMYVSGGKEAWEQAEKEGNIFGMATIDDGNTTSFDIALPYSSDFYFAIRTVSPAGKSEWYGYGDQIHWGNYLFMMTGERYAVPNVLSAKNNETTKTGARIYFKTNINQLTPPYDTESYYKNFNIDVNGNFGFTHLRVLPSKDTPEAKVDAKWNNYALTSTDLANGYVDIAGLSSNSVYTVDVIDSKVESPFDATYNTVMFRTKGDPAPPILIKHVAQATDYVNYETYDISKYNSCKLDDIINEYSQSMKVAENQVFYLEGGKAYHISSNVSLYKGLTLETNPEDIAAGKPKAILYISGITSSGNYPNTANFILGRQPMDGEDPSVPLDIDIIRFKNLDVQVPLARNYGHNNEGIGSASGNYFMNMYSNGMGVNLNCLEWIDCDFQGFIRGFFRTQGSYNINIHELNLKGCTFRNCGYYASGGNGYGYIYADMSSKPRSNILEKVEISDNIFYESPNYPLISDGNRNIMWESHIRWNLNIHHNTFVNWNTQGASSQSIINTRYVPGGSVLGFHDNLIIVTAKADDQRNLVQGGWDVRYIQGGDGTGRCTFNIGNNWTTSDTFTWANPGEFSGTSNAPGKFKSTCTYPYGTSELSVHVCDLKATDLMVDPNPPYLMDPYNSKSTDHYTAGIEGLYYQQTSAVKNSQIYKLKVGASRLLSVPAIKGDANNDGKLTMDDAFLIKDFYLGKLVNINLQQADINGDGKVNISDANCIINRCLGN